MKDPVLFTLARRGLRRVVLVVALLALSLLASGLMAQKSQEDYGDKFKVATDDGGVAIAASADGQYVFIVGKKGLVVSDDHGKTGSWVQTLRLK
ncbi:MAG: hypothetical protein ACE5IK_11620 [Acidobacteriota bacterium]